MSIIKTIIVIVFLFTRLSILGQSSDEFAKMTSESWRNDLQFFARELPKRHRNLFHTISRNEFETAINDLNQRIPKLSNNEVAVELAKIAAMIGGGHTEISLTRQVPGFSLFPIQFYFFGKKLYLAATTLPNAKYIGMQVLKIGNTPIGEVFERVKSSN